MKKSKAARNLQKKSSVLEPTSEERAFVYQQAIEVVPFIINQETVGVVLEKNQQKNKSKYSVTFILVPKVLNIEIQAEGDNLVDVCINAKNKAIQACRELALQWPTPDRKAKVSHFMQNPWEH